MDEINQIRERISVNDLISETIQLKKAGRNFKGLCPFHNEKTPSFVVSPERQIWHCFGCGKGGDIFTFLMELEHLEFPEALKILAERAGVKLTSRPEQSAQSQLRERLVSLHRLAQEYFRYILTKHALGERARRYLKERGMTDAAIETFGLGFAPQSWDNLTRFLLKKGYTRKELELSGLVVQSRSGFYDRFRDRIMFPLRDHRGQTIAFAGRVLDPKAQEAKYINSPETLLYTKGNTFFGLDVTKDAIRKLGAAVVVEGEFDLISSFCAGIPNVVAIKGSALTDAQVRLIKRFAEKLLLALDRDVAGDAAARRGIEIADKAGLEVRVVQVPTGKDPDEAARESPYLWKEAVEKAVPFYDFLIDSAFARYGVEDAFSKKKISGEVLPALVKIDNSIVQAHYVKQLSKRLDIPEEKVNEALKTTKVPLATSVKSAEKATVETKSHTRLMEEHLLTLILQSTDIKATLLQMTEVLDPSDLEDPVVRKICCSLLDFAQDQVKVDINQFARSLPPEVLPTLDRLYLMDLAPFSAEEQLHKELNKTLLNLRREILRRKIGRLATEISTAGKADNASRLEELHAELNQVTAALKALA